MCCKAYHRFEIAEEHRHKTAFTWKNVQYAFKGAPFGIKTLPSIFQRAMHVLLGDLPFVRVFIDDIIVFSESHREHLDHVHEVLRRLGLFNYFRDHIPLYARLAAPLEKLRKSQLVDGQEKWVSFVARSLQPAERNYSCTRIIKRWSTCGRSRSCRRSWSPTWKLCWTINLIWSTALVLRMCCQPICRDCLQNRL